MTRWGWRRGPREEEQEEEAAAPDAAGEEEELEEGSGRGGGGGRHEGRKKGIFVMCKGCFAKRPSVKHIIFDSFSVS